MRPRCSAPGPPARVSQDQRSAGRAPGAPDGLRAPGAPDGLRALERRPARPARPGARPPLCQPHALSRPRPQAARASWCAGTRWRGPAGLVPRGAPHRERVVRVGRVRVQADHVQARARRVGKQLVHDVVAAPVACARAALPVRPRAVPGASPSSRACSPPRANEPLHSPWCSRYCCACRAHAVAGVWDDNSVRQRRRRWVRPAPHAAANPQDKGGGHGHSILQQVGTAGCGHAGPAQP